MLSHVVYVVAAYGSKVGPRLNPEDGSTSPHSSSSAHTSPTTRIRQRVRPDADNKKLVHFFFFVSTLIIATEIVDKPHSLIT